MTVTPAGSTPPAASETHKPLHSSPTHSRATASPAGHTRPSVHPTLADVTLAGAEIDFHGTASRNRHCRETILDTIAGFLDSSADPQQHPAIAQLERACAFRIGRRYVAAVSSGTAALQLALTAAGIGPGDDVLVTGFSFIASASAIAQVGARPVFLPIDPTTYLTDLAALDAAVTPTTAAIVAVHLFGRCLPAATLEAFAHRRGLVLIEDAAQAFGCRHHGRAAGTYGQISAVSLDPTKVLGGITAGGLVLTDDEQLHNKVTALAAHGRGHDGNCHVIGQNSRMSPVNAAVVQQHLRRLDTWRTARARVATTYRDALADLPITLPPPPDDDHLHDTIDNHHKFVIATPRRDALRLHLTQADVPTKIHYATALADHPALAAVSDAPLQPEAARTAARTVLSLPIHPYLSGPHIEQIVTAIRTFSW